MSAPLVCLHTTVRNMTANSRFFSFLGHNGMRLASGEQAMVRGDIRTVLAVDENPRDFKALNSALTDGDLAILSTPTPVYYDAHASKLKPSVLSIVNGSATVTDPCWGAYGSVG